MFDPGSGACQAKKGLLVLRECGQTAIGACGGCGMRLCSKHQIINPRGAVLCPDCAANDQSLAPTGDVGRARRRAYYYGNYGYPYYFGTGHQHFHDSDQGRITDRSVGGTDNIQDADDLGDFDATES